MILKSRLHLILFWMISLIISLGSCLSNLIMSADIYNRIDSLDSKLLGSIGFSILGFFLHVLLYFAFLILIIFLKNFRIDFWIWLPSRSNWYIQVARISGYLIVAIVIYSFLDLIVEYKIFLLSEIIFLINAITTILMYMIWFCSWFSSYKYYEAN